MLSAVLWVLFLVCFPFAASQQIWDLWQTTWDRSKLFTSLKPSSPINFVQPGPAGEADIVVDERSQYQTMLGFGASLTDSSAHVLGNLKTRYPSNYWSVLNTVFNPSPSSDGAGLSYIRIPVGASDFSAGAYSLNDNAGDEFMIRFDMNRVPPYTFAVLRDMMGINSLLKFHLNPWSPPAWMKTNMTMNGGSLQERYIPAYARYLLKAVQGFRTRGVPVYAISTTFQNEPQNSNPTYPTCLMSPDLEARIVLNLRDLLDSNGLGNVKIVGYEHNWDHATSYPVNLVDESGGALSGIAFHCYAGSVKNQELFHSTRPNHDIYFTECSGTYGSDWWSDIKWYMDNLWVGSVERFARTGLMWNIALDGSGNPKYPGTDSCGGPGCRPLVTVNNDGSYTFNQEFYAMAQASKAILPQDAGGPFGQRIGTTVKGGKGWALRVSGFVTGRTSQKDWFRYSLVVLNWNDGGSNGWSPSPVKTTINFRGMQATYTFPVGVTTLWWYAPG
ncbi:glycoside hydrolase [Coprinellus micaceus]|uniref:Glycoside hydrolase n=1 Tax=Coprinellus micaceus TaxID=71717 RepID=A0A4Y7SH95_COPMI|nr:glycoside hydrolase [Coprinellus micaceus]